MGVIDTLSAGFSTVTRRLWLLLLPIALDLALWLGPKLSIAPAVARTLDWMQSELDAMAATAGAAASPELLDTFRASAAELREMTANTNLLWLTNSGLGLPSVASLHPIDAAHDWIVPIAGMGTALWLSLGLLALGLFITCVYLALIGQAVHGRPLDVGQALRSAPRYWLYLVVVFVPLVGVLMSVLSFGALLGPLVYILAGVALWVILYVYFVPQAITMTDAEPMNALRDSFIVVRLSFWRTFALVALSQIILAGLRLIWIRLAPSSAGMLAAIVANAFIGTGLTAAAFIFFRDRIAMWHEFVRQQRNATSNG